MKKLTINKIKLEQIHLICNCYICFDIKEVLTMQSMRCACKSSVRCLQSLRLKQLPAHQLANA